MKTILSLILLASSVSATAADKGTLKCVRRVVEKKMLDADALVKAAAFVDAAKAGAGDASTCRRLKRDARGLPFMSKEAVVQMIDQLGEEGRISADAHVALLKFASPKIHCELYGVEGHFVLGVGAGAGVAVGACRSDSGRKFAVVVPSVGVGVGIAMDALVIDSGFEYEPGEIIVTEKQSLCGLLGMVRNKADYGFCSTPDAVGLGAGMAGIAAANLPLRLIPLGNDFTHIFEQENK